MATRQQESDFINAVKETIKENFNIDEVWDEDEIKDFIHKNYEPDLFDDLEGYVQKKYYPNEIFPEEELIEWAEKNGYKKE